MNVGNKMKRYKPLYEVVDKKWKDVVRYYKEYKKHFFLMLNKEHPEHLSLKQHKKLYTLYSHKYDNLYDGIIASFSVATSQEDKFIDWINNQEKIIDKELEQYKK